jgi:hypothetical protein
MDGYTDDSVYTIVFASDGYLHEVHMDSWITADAVCVALSLEYGNVELEHNFNGAKARYDSGRKVWSDLGITESV